MPSLGSPLRLNDDFVEGLALLLHSINFIQQQQSLVHQAQ